MHVLLNECEKLSLAQTRLLWRDKPPENLDQEGLQLLNQIKLGEVPVIGLLEEFPEFALRHFLLLD